MAEEIVQTEENDKIEDVGEYIPYAAKHVRFNLKTEQTEKAQGSVILLKTLWPEPNWKDMIASGRDPYMVARLFCVYRSMRHSPRSRNAYRSNISTQEWEIAYIDAVSRMKHYFSQCITVDDVKRISARFAKDLGCGTTTAIAKEKTVKEGLPYWSFGHGDRLLTSPTTLQPSLSRIADYLPDFGWPEDDAILKLKKFPLKFKDGTYAVGYSERGGVYFNNEDAKLTREACIAKIQSLLEEQSKEETINDGIPDRPVLTGAEKRVGENHRQGRNISADEIMSVFRFRAVQFGNSLSNKERQEWINSLYDALMDLSFVLGLPPKWMGLGGIAIAAGARGKGNAMAHYEPALRVINLTRRTGPGTLAHEWFHALDYRLSSNKDRLTVTYYSETALSELLKAYSINLEGKDRFKPVVEALKDVVEAIFSSSDYLTRSKGRKGKKRRSVAYWTSTIELIARAFEAYVSIKVAQKKHKNKWLVNGAVREDYPSSENLSFFPYPEGKELDELVVKFDVFFVALKTM
jgi:hypothetical protein